MSGLRNVAIIAHVDHGKTTLVDKIIHHCNVIDPRKATGDLILDNNDLERERGITIPVTYTHLTLPTNREV